MCVWLVELRCKLPLVHGLNTIIQNHIPVIPYIMAIIYFSWYRLLFYVGFVLQVGLYLFIFFIYSQMQAILWWIMGFACPMCLPSFSNVFLLTNWPLPTFLYWLHEHTICIPYWCGLLIMISLFAVGTDCLYLKHLLWSQVAYLWPCTAALKKHYLWVFSSLGLAYNCGSTMVKRRPLFHGSAHYPAAYQMTSSGNTR